MNLNEGPTPDRSRLALAAAPPFADRAGRLYWPRDVVAEYAKRGQALSAQLGMAALAPVAFVAEAFPLTRPVAGPDAEAWQRGAYGPERPLTTLEQIGAGSRLSTVPVLYAGPLQLTEHSLGSMAAWLRAQRGLRLTYPDRPGLQLQVFDWTWRAVPILPGFGPTSAWSSSWRRSAAPRYRSTLGVCASGGRNLPCVVGYRLEPALAPDEGTADALQVKDWRIGGVWDSIAHVVKKGAAAVVQHTPGASTASAIVKIAHGQNVLRVMKTAVKEEARAIKEAARIAGPLVATFPGVGSATAAALAAAQAVGEGKSLKNVALAAARGAVPGGPLGQMAFDVAVGVAEGKKLDAVALNAVRNQIPNPQARAAFDAGVAVSRGADPRAVVEAAAKKELGRVMAENLDKLGVPVREAARLFEASRIARGEGVPAVPTAAYKGAAA